MSIHAARVCWTSHGELYLRVMVDEAPPAPSPSPQYPVGAWPAARVNPLLASVGLEEAAEVVMYVGQTCVGRRLVPISLWREMLAVASEREVRGGYAPLRETKVYEGWDDRYWRYEPSWGTDADTGN